MKRDLRERFFEKVRKIPGGCWEWQGGFFANGYGIFSIDNYPNYAHAVSWELHHKAMILRGMGFHLCHTCDNRWCVNPKHLYLGDASTNHRDLAERGANPNSPKRRFVNGKWQWIKESA